MANRYPVTSASPNVDGDTIASGVTVWQGAWSGATTYAVGATVSRNGSSYRSLVADNLNNAPESSPSEWGLLAAKGDTGAAGADGADGDDGADGPPGPAPEGDENDLVTLDGGGNAVATSLIDVLRALLADDGSLITSIGGSPAELGRGDARQYLRVKADETGIEWATLPAPTPRYIPLGGYARVDATQGTVVIGGSPEYLDPDEHAVEDRTQVWTFTACASVTTGQTATIDLYDLLAEAVVATLTVTSDVPGTQHTDPVDLPEDPTSYEVHVEVDGTTTSHAVVIIGCAIKQTWS